MAIRREEGAPSKLTLLRRGLWLPAHLRGRVERFDPRSDVGLWAKGIMRYLPADEVARGLDILARSGFLQGHLRGLVQRADGAIEDLGLISEYIVTTAGVNYLVTVIDGGVSGGALKYHGLGTGSATPAIGDTALGTELTTAYNPDNTRATGTSTVGSSSNIYHSAGTNTVDGAAAVTEWGLFSASSAGTMLDRATFSVINLASGDGLTTTFDLTLSAGG